MPESKIRDSQFLVEALIASQQGRSPAQQRSGGDLQPLVDFLFPLRNKHGGQPELQIGIERIQIAGGLKPKLRGR